MNFKIPIPFIGVVTIPHLLQILFVLAGVVTFSGNSAGSLPSLCRNWDSFTFAELQAVLLLQMQP